MYSVLYLCLSLFLATSIGTLSAPMEQAKGVAYAQLSVDAEQASSDVHTDDPQEDEGEESCEHALGTHAVRPHLHPLSIALTHTPPRFLKAVQVEDFDRPPSYGT